MLSWASTTYFRNNQDTKLIAWAGALFPNVISSKTIN